VRSYPLLVDGADRAGAGWTYVLHADALVARPREAFAAKRRLELGRDASDEDRALCVARCAISGEDDGSAALAAAVRAGDDLLDVDVATRRELGRLIHARVEQRQDELLEVLVAEGHPRRLAETEVEGFLVGLDPRTQDWCFGQMERELEGDGERVVLARKPDGVVCVNPPQNTAASSAALGIYALLAANAVVIKAPITAPLGVMFTYRELVLPALADLGLPLGAVNLISAATKPVLRQWLASDLVDDILYFGDSPSGLALAGDCLARGKKAILELSGNDAVVVWRDADLDAAADAVCQAFYGSTQVCMVPKQVLVHRDAAEGLVARVTSRARALRPGMPSDPDVVLSPVLKPDQFFDVLAEAEAAGARTLCGGRRVDVDGAASATGLFLEPTVVLVDGLERGARLRCVSEETFFPLLPLVVLDDEPDDRLLERVLAHLDGNRYGLRNSLWARDDAVVDAVARRVRNGGMLLVNRLHLSFVPYMATHGGTGRSGGPGGELHYPMLRTSHLQGIVRPEPERVAGDAGAPTREKVPA